MRACVRACVRALCNILEKGRARAGRRSLAVFSMAIKQLNSDIDIIDID